MPAQYEAMRDKFHSEGLSLPAAKTKAAKIYNSRHHDAPVTGKMEPAMSKSSGLKTAHYASGGAVLGKTSEFLKTEDQFRAPYHKDPNAGKDKPYGKPGVPGAGTGEVHPPKAKGKSLTPVKPKS
jgi:hypothetical protein